MSRNEDDRSKWIKTAHKHFDKEETAAEFPVTQADISVANQAEAVRAVRSAGATLGWVAMGFAVASWFFWPIWMGIAASLLGLGAYFQGNRSLGITSMTIGLIAVVVYLVLIPLYYIVA